MSGAAPSDEIVFYGIAAASGVIHGPAYLFFNREMEVPRFPVAPELREDEISRFEQGLLETRKQISAIRAEVEEKVGESEASIFDAHQLVLEDRALIEDTVREVEQSGLNIEYCFHTVANRYIDAFSRIDDEYIKERLADIRDVTRRVLNNLMGQTTGRVAAQGDRNVLVAEDLSPSEAATINVQNIVGIVTQSGSRTSHAVIVARSLDIPCVVGVHGVMDQVRFGDELLIDGFDGKVILRPTANTLHVYGQIQTQRQQVVRIYNSEKHLAAETVDRHPVPILLNVEGMESESVLRNSGASGVGLFRTEMLFLSGRDFPNEEAQLLAFRRIVECVAPHPVTIRTLDLGGDKNPHKSLYGYQESNPFMGFRAIRFCLENPQLFKEQLRAILRASAFGKVKIMYPMICSCEELVAANQLLEEAKTELRDRNQPFDENIERGCMIEVPSAVIIADLLARHCEFFSIGTNDLIQYLLAVDRVNDRIAHLYRPANPAIMRSIGAIFAAGRRAGIPVSVCGEMAGDPLYAALLFGLGAAEISLSWNALAEIKYLLRRSNMASLRALATEVLSADDTDQIEAKLEAFQHAVFNPVTVGQ
jgi:phosphoenolpyruvate-protein phosphotransferase (PTS system enzyme I)